MLFLGTARISVSASIPPNWLLGLCQNDHLLPGTCIKDTNFPSTDRQSVAPTTHRDGNLKAQIIDEEFE